MIKILTLDCETTVGYPKGDSRWEQPELMPLAVIGIETEGWGPRESLWYTPSEAVAVLLASNAVTHHGTVQQILNTADIVLTFNGERFDFAVLEGAGFNVEHARAHSFDLMAEFVKVAGHRISLANFTQALGVTEKTGSGENAVQLWQAAQYLMNATEYGDNPHASKDAICRLASFRAGAKHLY